MAKDIISNLARLMILKYRNHNLDRSIIFNHRQQRFHINFGDIFTKLTKKFNDTFDNKPPIIAEKQNIVKSIESANNDSEKTEVSNQNLFKEIISTNSKLLKIPSSNLTQNYQTLLKHNLNQSLIKHHTYLLEYNNKELEEKLSLISQFGVELNDGILFTKLDMKHLKTFLQNCEKENIKVVDKIKMMCELSQEEIHDMCRHFCKCKYLRNEDVSILKEKIKLLQDEGFQFNEIIKDNVLGYKIETIKSKLNVIKENNIQERDISMICQPISQIKMKSVDDKKTNDVDEQESVIVDYMSKRMNCDNNIVLYMISKNPKLKNIKTEKLKQVFDLFNEYEVNLNELMAKPKIFNRKTDLLKERLQKMKKMNCDISSNIIYLTKTNKEFEDLMKKEPSI